MPTTREEALVAIGRQGKACDGLDTFAGQVLEVDPTGDRLLMQRGRGARAQSRWVHRDNLQLDPPGAASASPTKHP